MAGPRQRGEPRQDRRPGGKTRPAADLVAGVRPVEEALRGGRRVLRVMIDPSARPSSGARAAADLATRLGVPVVPTDRAELDARSGGALHQGIAAELEAFVYLDLDTLLARLSDRGGATGRVLAVLDGVTDPHNLGAILRSADASGVSGLIIPEHGAAGVTPVVAKSAAGAEEHVPIARVTNLTRTVARLKEQDYWVYGADAAPGAVPLWECDLAGDVAIVLGSEGKGISRLVAESCDGFVSIPMAGMVSSLNVSVAAALIFFELRRRAMTGR